MTHVEEPSASGPYEKDGRAWRVGTQDDVSWIQHGLTRGTAITAAIPPMFEAYATIALCEGDPGDRVPTDPDAAVLESPASAYHPTTVVARLSGDRCERRGLLGSTAGQAVLRLGLRDGVCRS